jgi:hypothetical protein
MLSLDETDAFDTNENNLPERKICRFGEGFDSSL